MKKSVYVLITEATRQVKQVHPSNRVVQVCNRAAKSENLSLRQEPPFHS